jgi:hypothetical protein
MAFLTIIKALVRASREPERYRDILNNVKGLIFLGTPHFGTLYSKYARQAAIRLDRLGSNPDVFLPLAVNSSQLLELHQEYLERYRDLDVVNFYETHKQELFRTPFGKFPYKIMVCHSLAFPKHGANKFLVDRREIFSYI